MDKRIQEILQEAFREVVQLPIDNLDKVDPNKLTKLAQKTDVVIGESDVDPNVMKDVKSIIFSIIEELGLEEAAHYLTRELHVTPLSIATLVGDKELGLKLDDFLKNVPAEKLIKFRHEEIDRLQPILNETVSIDEILDPSQVKPGMEIYSEYEAMGHVVVICQAGDYMELYQYDSNHILPSKYEPSEMEEFMDTFSPDDDYLVAIKLSDDETLVGAYGPNDFYVPKDGNSAPNDGQDRAGSRAPASSEAPSGVPLRETEFPTATPEQQQALFDVQTWASELGLDIGVGEETVGDIIKFGFEGSEGWITILVDPNGTIKVSGHTIKNHEDFSDIVDFFQQ